jgi:hypothetical protein
MGCPFSIVAELGTRTLEMETSREEMPAEGMRDAGKYSTAAL